jgi:hypothetical protein
VYQEQRRGIQEGFVENREVTTETGHKTSGVEIKTGLEEMVAPVETIHEESQFTDLDATAGPKEIAAETQEVQKKEMNFDRVGTRRTDVGL